MPELPTTTEATETKHETNGDVNTAAPTKVRKKAAKKAAKKVKAKKAAKPKKPAKEADPVKAKLRRQGKAIEVSMPQYVVLKALGKATKPLSYRDIEEATGYYAPLTAMMRTDHKESLSSKKLVREMEIETETGGDKLVFEITAAGRKALKKAAEVA